MKPRWVSPRTGCSTLITSAPQSARMALATGTKVNCASSRMRTPSMTLTIFVSQLAGTNPGSREPTFCRLRALAADASRDQGPCSLGKPGFSPPPEKAYGLYFFDSTSPPVGVILVVLGDC